jgi:hypothetical protein
MHGIGFALPFGFDDDTWCPHMISVIRCRLIMSVALLEMLMYGVYVFCLSYGMCFLGIVRFLAGAPRLRSLRWRRVVSLLVCACDMTRLYVSL